MKKLFFLLLASGATSSLMAQDLQNRELHCRKDGTHCFAADSLLSHWVVDINGFVGGMSQNVTMANTLNNYANNIASLSNTGSLKFTNGMSYGFDAQVGYFFGKRNNWGIGLGFMYMGQQGDMTLNQFNVQYQSTDNNGNTFRQIINADGPIKEKLNITNMNIPLVLKYKHRFSRRIGFTADLGALFNVQMHNAYSSNASFDYQAIYKLQNVTSGPAIYESNATPASTDILYTTQEYKTINPTYTTSSLNSYFNSTLRNAGYNVGLGIMPNKNSGSVNYTTGSVGLLFQPGVNYYFNDNIALNLGVYYIYQPFKNSVPNGYMLTNKVGDYNSVLNSVSSGNSQSYGLNVGVRIYLGKGKDSDHDGIPNREDWCPYTYGSEYFHGCPDTDGDGIPDYEDSCVRVPGLAKFHGCPDTDGDGIPDKVDSCPTQAGSIALHGCPDRDGDGIIDKNDKCPDQPGLAQFQGCPDRDGDGVPDNEDNCPDQPGPVENHGCPYPKAEPAAETVKVSTPILFEVNKTVIHHSSYPVLDEAVKKLNADKDAYVVVDGYTDNTGSRAYNKGLSVRRANAVKAHLIKLGIKANRIKIAGHGMNSPAADNSTEEGRLKNRRAVMHLSIGDE
jgi:outer membrane protein OmpA-like peptidoglycan-associated protein